MGARGHTSHGSQVDVGSAASGGACLNVGTTGARADGEGRMRHVQVNGEYLNFCEIVIRRVRSLDFILSLVSFLTSFCDDNLNVSLG